MCARGGKIQVAGASVNVNPRQRPRSNGASQRSPAPDRRLSASLHIIRGNPERAPHVAACRANQQNPSSPFAKIPFASFLFFRNLLDSPPNQLYDRSRPIPSEGRIAI